MNDKKTNIKIQILLNLLSSSPMSNAQYLHLPIPCILKENLFRQASVFIKMNWLERLTSPRQQQTSMSFEQLCVDHERITQEKEDLHALAWMLPGVFPAQIQSVDKHSQQLTVQYSIHLSYAAESPFRRDLVQISRFVHWKYVLCCPEVVSPFFSLHSETDHISLRLPLSVYAQWESEIFKTLPTIVDRELDGAEDL